MRRSCRFWPSGGAAGAPTSVVAAMKNNSAVKFEELAAWGLRAHLAADFTKSERSCFAEACRCQVFGRGCLIQVLGSYDNCDILHKLAAKVLCKFCAAFCGSCHPRTGNYSSSPSSRASSTKRKRANSSSLLALGPFNPVPTCGS